MASKATPVDPMDPSYDPEDKYQAQSDADTLKRHAQITSNPERHAAAHEVLQQQQKLGQAAVRKSGKSLNAKVKHGLKKAFPSPNDGDGKGKTPFEAAEGNAQED